MTLQKLFIEHIGKLGRNLNRNEAALVDRVVKRARVVNQHGATVWFGDIDFLGDMLGIQEVYKIHAEPFTIVKTVEIEQVLAKVGPDGILIEDV